MALKVLVACEESQAVCKAFRERGHRAFSADIQPCSGGHPEWHIQDDVLPLINGRCEFETMDGQKHAIDGKWDLIIAHPPCTDLAVSGARHFARKRADGSQQKSIDRLAAYEDTGLEPEQCAKYAQAEKEGRYIVLKEPRSAGVHSLEEIARADIEGRLLVLPCKVGDIVFLIVPRLSSPMPVPVCSLTWRGGKWSINADREETEPPKVVGFQIGKTAFLTREDAEKALEEKE